MFGDVARDLRWLADNLERIYARVVDPTPDHAIVGALVDIQTFFIFCCRLLNPILSLLL